jgi:hypothetical protein
MFTGDVVVLLILAFVPLAGAVSLLVYGIYAAITDKDLEFCIGMIVCFLFLSGLSGIMSVGAYKEYQNAIPQNQVKILRQKISDAEKELQKYLIDHPNLKAKENYTK